MGSSNYLSSKTIKGICPGLINVYFFFIPFLSGSPKKRKKKKKQSSSSKFCCFLKKARRKQREFYSSSPNVNVHITINVHSTSWRASGTAARPLFRHTSKCTNTHRCTVMWRWVSCLTMLMSDNGVIIWDCVNDSNGAPGIVTSQNRAGDGCH